MFSMKCFLFDEQQIANSLNQKLAVPLHAAVVKAKKFKLISSGSAWAPVHLNSPLVECVYKRVCFMDLKMWQENVWPAHTHTHWQFTVSNVVFKWSLSAKNAVGKPKCWFVFYHPTNHNARKKRHKTCGQNEERKKSSALCKWSLFQKNTESTDRFVHVYSLFHAHISVDVAWNRTTRKLYSTIVCRRAHIKTECRAEVK